MSDFIPYFATAFGLGFGIIFGLATAVYLCGAVFMVCDKLFNLLQIARELRRDEAAKL
jgi:hypothetical protein